MTANLATSSATSASSLVTDWPERTTVDGLTIKAPNYDYLDDTKDALLSRTVRRILARGFDIEGIYLDDEETKLDTHGWVNLGHRADGLCARRTYLIDVTRGTEKVGTVRVIEARRRTATRLLGRNEHGREVWRHETQVRAAVHAEDAVLAILRG